MEKYQAYSHGRKNMVKVGVGVGLGVERDKEVLQGNRVK